MQIKIKNFSHSKKIINDLQDNAGEDNIFSKLVTGIANSMVAASISFSTGTWTNAPDEKWVKNVVGSISSLMEVASKYDKKAIA